jgi:hypothetical protein
LKDAKVAKEMASASDLAEAQKRWLKCCGDNRLKAFLHFRDKYLAHLGEPEPSVAFPTYGDVFALARETTAVIEKLAHAAGVVTLALDTQVPTHKTSAEKFWSVWENR